MCFLWNLWTVKDNFTCICFLLLETHESCCWEGKIKCLVSECEPLQVPQGDLGYVRVCEAIGWPPRRCHWDPPQKDPPVGPESSPFAYFGQRWFSQLQVIECWTEVALTAQFTLICRTWLGFKRSPAISNTPAVQTTFKPGLPGAAGTYLARAPHSVKNDQGAAQSLTNGLQSSEAIFHNSAENVPWGGYSAWHLKFRDPHNRNPYLKLHDSVECFKVFFLTLSHLYYF